MMYDYFYGEQGEQYSFYRIPKILFTDERFQNMTTDAKALYGLLLDRVSLSVENGWLDKLGRVYIIFTLEQVMKSLGCADKKATRLLVELEQKYGLIERKRQGMGKPTLIYVKNFFQDSSNERFKSRQNNDSRLVKTTIHDSSKQRGIKTDSNNTDFNKTNLILSEQEAKEEMDEREAYRKIIMQRIEYEAILRNYPFYHEVAEEILCLLVDVLCSHKRFIRIGGDDKPGQVVKGQLMKLDYSHICYVLECLKENTTDVRNTRQYLLATLYNAPMTIGTHYHAQFNHDRAEGRI